MLKQLAAAALSLMAVFGVSSAAQAETVLEKVARTGTLTLGTSLNIIPYAYVDSDQNVVGYSMDVVERIRLELEALLGREVVLEVVELNSEAAQITAVEAGTIDIACASRFTWERDQYVDFSVSYGISGIRLLALRGSDLQTPETLAGKTIGVVPGSLGAQAIALLDVDVTTVTVSDREAALDALDAGELDAIAGDTLLLAGAILPRNFDQYQLAPVEPLTRYGIACMVPENNSGFLDTVNFALVKLMEGYVSGEPESVATLDRWFGDQGLIRIPSTVIENFFRSIILTREQVYLGDD